MPSKTILFGLSYSPWTERARWALDFHGVDYIYREHAPLIGEWLLRFRRRKISQGKATVPFLINEEGALGDSFEIMMYADERAPGLSLGLDRPPVTAWRAPVEEALEEMRVRVSRRVLNDPEALREAAAVAVPEVLSGLCKPVAALGVRYFSKKYDFELERPAEAEPYLTGVLSRARARLSDGRQYLEGEFSAADMMVATLLQAVEPVDNQFIPLGPATREAWRSESLVNEYADLVAWRDRVYLQHRRTLVDP